MRKPAKKNESEEIIKMDEKDKKILKILIENARMPLTQISKSVRLSHDAVNYRIKRMKQAGIIEVFTAVVNPAKLGLPIWGEVILSLCNLTPKRFEEFQKYIKYHPNIAAVWNMSGKYEWWIEIYTKSLSEFNEIINELKVKFSDIIKDSETMFVLKEVKAWQSLPQTYPGI